MVDEWDSQEIGNGLDLQLAEVSMSILLGSNGEKLD